mgnify:FL=1
MNRKILKIAHRGYSSKYKDNSMESFHGALQNNFDMIEMDIQLCKSNEIIIFHDNYKDDKFIRDMTLKEIQTKDKDIITLEYFFNQFDYTKIQIYLDLKGSNQLSYYLFHFIEKNKINTEKIYFASFNMKHIDYLYNKNNNLNFGIITYNNFTNFTLEHYIKKFNLQFVCIDWSVLDNETISYIHKLKTKVFACTAKSDLSLYFIKKYDIDGIVSDILL